jgi:hypothetical protein
MTDRNPQPGDWPTAADVIEDPALTDMPPPDDGTCTCGHDGLDSMFHLGGCPHAEAWRNRGKAKS